MDYYSPFIPCSLFAKERYCTFLWPFWSSRFNPLGTWPDVFTNDTLHVTIRCRCWCWCRHPVAYGVSTALGQMDALYIMGSYRSNTDMVFGAALVGIVSWSQEVSSLDVALWHDTSWAVEGGWHCSIKVHYIAGVDEGIQLPVSTASLYLSCHGRASDRTRMVLGMV